MSAVNDTASEKMVEAPSQSSWERLRAVAVSEGTKFSQTEIKLASLLGVYCSVWDSYTMLEIMDDIGEEESSIKLTIKNPKNLEDASFADIEGRFRWWGKVGSFKGLTRVEGSKENLWLVNGVTWSALVDVDDHEGKEPYEDDEDTEIRATNDFGLACLVTLDSAGNPFLEMLYNNAESINPEVPGEKYVRVIWKKQKEGRRGLLMLTGGEARRLMKDGAADLTETRESGAYSCPLGYEDEDEDREHNEDAEGDSEEELQLQSANLKRRADQDEDEEEEGPGMKRHKR